MTMPVSRPVASTTPVQPSRLALIARMTALEGRRLRDTGIASPWCIELGHADQATADRAARVQPRHVVGAEPAPRQHRDGEGVAQREGGGGATRWA